MPEDIGSAYDLMTRMLVAGRLLAPGGKEPPECAALALAKACGEGSYDDLLHHLTNARQSVMIMWNNIFGQPIEDQDP